MEDYKTYELSLYELDGSVFKVKESFVNEAKERKSDVLTLNQMIGEENAQRLAGDASLSSELSAVSNDFNNRFINLSYDTSNLATSLNNEKLRAQGVEATLSASLDAEIKRAQGAESALSASLTADNSNLTASLDAEVKRAQQVEQGLQSQISNVLANTDAQALNSLAELVADYRATDTTLGQRLTALEAIVANLRGRA